MQKTKVLIWDAPTRVFHWLLAAAFVGAFVTADSERLRNVHVALGYTMLGLIAFRVLWGVIGTRYARFGSFAFGPRSVMQYLKSLFTHSPQHHPGHNPAGSWAIYALLGLTLVAGASGYATYNDIGGGWLESLHEGAANTLLAMVIVHVAGVVVSSFVHRENLARAMLTGCKSGHPRDSIRRGYPFIAAILMLATVTFLWACTEVPPASWSGAHAARSHTMHERHH